MLGDGVVNVGYCGHLFLVADEGHLIFGDVPLVEEALDVQTCEVRRGIIDNDYMVILVILVEDALEIEFVSEVFGVVIGRDNDAKR